MKTYKVSIQRLRDIIRYYEQDKPTAPLNCYVIDNQGKIFLEVKDSE